MTEALIQRIGDARLLPVLRAESAAAAIDLAHRLVVAGLGAVELTAKTSGRPDAVPAMRREHPDSLVGAGTS